LAYVFAVSDQQIGKKTPTGGTPEFVDRVMQMTDESIHRLKELRKIGRNIGTVVIPLLGDHVEGNTSQKGKLQSQYASDLGMTEQTRVARRILMEQIKAFAPLADRIIVPVVNGNHDEVTRDVVVDPADGWNVEIASAVQDACAENPNLGHIEFRFPSPGNQTLSVDINGTMLGLFHGHQISGKNVINYLSGQAVGQTPLGNCDVWLSGHYHHFNSLDIGTRFWAQCPTLDGGSGWFKERRGLDSHPGVLTMVIGGDYDPRRDLSILRIKR
jgi:predicted phosphodiesterase